PLISLIRNNYHWIIILILMGLAIYTIYQDQIKQEIIHERLRRNHLLRQRAELLKNHYYQKIKENQKAIKSAVNQPSIEQTNMMALNESKRKELIEHYLSLKDLYYNGIPDKYDNNGFKIKGVPPDPDLALY